MPAPPDRSPFSGARRRRLRTALMVGLGAALFLAVPRLREQIPTKPATWLIVAGIAVGWFLIARFVLRPLVRNGVARTVLTVGPPLVFAAWALVPGLFDKVVNEDFPVVAAVGSPAATTPLPAPGSSTTPPSTPGVVPTTPAPVPDASQAPPTTPKAPSPTAATVPSRTTPTPTPPPPTAPRAAVPPPTAPPTTPAPPAQPVRLKQGSFKGLAGHRGAGQAVLYRLADGSELLRLENLDLQNGPDLLVYLVPRAGQVDLAGAVGLGALKGNKGNQNYPVPSGVSASGYSGVLVWCRAFTVEFAGASLLSV